MKALNSSGELRIRSEGRVEVIEEATVRLLRECASFDADEPPRIRSELSADEQLAVNELERLEPGSSFVRALRAAERVAREAEEKWQRRLGLISAGPHLPVRFDERMRIVGEPPLSRGVIGIVAGGAGALVTATLAAMHKSVLLALASLGVALLGASFPAWPRRKRVVVTRTSLVFDGQEVLISNILEASNAGTSLELQLRDGRVVRLNLSGKVPLLVDCLADAAKELERSAK